MNLWEQLNDFSEFNKRIPCVLCQGESEPTLVGNHWKCSKDGHIFNQDGSATGVECWCETCKPPIQVLYDEAEKKALAKKIGKTKKGKSK